MTKTKGWAVYEPNGNIGYFCDNPAVKGKELLEWYIFQRRQFVESGGGALNYASKHGYTVAPVTITKTKGE